MHPHLNKENFEFYIMKRLVVVGEGLVVNSHCLVVISSPFFDKKKFVGGGANFKLTQRVEISYFFFVGLFVACLVAIVS